MENKDINHEKIVLVISFIGLLVGILLDVASNITLSDYNNGLIKETLYFSIMTSMFFLVMSGLSAFSIFSGPKTNAIYQDKLLERSLDFLALALGIIALFITPIILIKDDAWILITTVSLIAIAIILTAKFTINSIRKSITKQ